MRRIVLLFSLTVALAVSQNWVLTLDSGSQGDDEPASMVLDDSGGIYVTGKTERNSYTIVGTVKANRAGEQEWLTFYDPYPGFSQIGRAIAVDEGSNCFVTVASKDTEDVLCYATIKYGHDGETLWVARYSDTSRYSDVPYDIALTPTSRCVVTGYSGKNTADKDLATISYDSSGNEQWIRKHNGSAGGIDYSYTVATDAQGFAYVAGYATEGVRERAIIIKYDSLGTQEWLYLHIPRGPYDDCAGLDIAVEPAGSVNVAGFVGSFHFKLLTMKFNSQGETLWTREYPWGWGVAVAVDSASNVYTVGSTDEFGSSYDIVTVKYDSEGNLLWDARYDGPDQMNDWGYDLALDPDGSVYVCGRSESSARGNECILIKYDSLGDTVWTARIPGHERYGSVFNAVEVDNGGNIIVAGCICSEGTGKDYIIAKYPPSGPGVEEPRKPMLVTRHAIAVVPSVVCNHCVFTVMKPNELSDLRILDISGRTVRELVLPPGETSMTWNVTDELGRLVPNGVYFAVLESPDSRATAKFLIQR